MTVSIILTLAGTNTGPFNIYSNSDSYTTPIVTGVAKATLEAGYELSGVPIDATMIRVKSTSSCTNQIDLPIADLPTTTTTSTSTTTTTTTAAPVPTSKITNYGTRSITGILRKNGEYVVSFSVGISGAFYNMDLGGVTWGPMDDLTLTMASTNPYGGSFTVNTAALYPNQIPASVLPSNYNGQGTSTVEVIFNGLGGGWDVNPMVSFDIVLTAV